MKTTVFRRFLLLLLASTSAITMIGCDTGTSSSTSASSKATLPPGILYTAGNSENGGTLKVSIGDTIDVKLQEIGPCGAYDTMPQVSTSAVEFVKNLPNSMVTPAGPLLVYQFLAVDSGSAEISICGIQVHSDMCAGIQAPKFSFTIIVK